MKTSFKTRALLFISTTILLNKASAMCDANLLANGSFNGTVGENVTATGWTGQLTPDLNDNSGTLFTTTGYTWASLPIASNDGGTWQNIAGGEALSQIVSLIPGHSYQLCLEYTSQQIQSSSSSLLNPAGAFVLLNNSIILTTPLDSSFNTWENMCINFTAPAQVDTFKIRCTLGGYLAVDGICLIDRETSDISTSLSGPYFNIFTDNSSTFHILNTAGSGYHLHIFDSSSRCLINRKFNGDLNYNFSEFPEGIYFYSVKYGERILSGKFVKH
jgi:hypothetical protein